MRKWKKNKEERIQIREKRRKKVELKIGGKRKKKRPGKRRRK